MLGSYTVLPSPSLFPSLSACTNIPSGRKLCLHLPLLLHKRNPLCPPCGFLAEQIRTLLVQQGSGGAGHGSDLGAAPGLLQPPCSHGPRQSLRVKWHFASGAGEVCERDPAGICWVLPPLLPFAAMILMWVNALFNSAGKPRRLLGSAA